MRFERAASYFWRGSINFINLSGHRLLHFPLPKEPQVNLLFPIVAVLLVATFFGTQREVTVSVDNESVVIKTHLGNVGAILRDAGITVQPGDVVFPPISSSLSDGKSIFIKRSRPVILHADGTTYSFRTQGKSVAEVVRERGLDLRKEDAIYVGDRQITQDADLPTAETGGSSKDLRETDDKSRSTTLALTSRGDSGDHSSPPPGGIEPLELTIERAVPIFVHDGETHGEIYSTRRVLGDVFSDQGVTIYGGDLVFPRLGTQVSANMHVFILRAKPITIEVDGRSIQSRTQAKTIEEAILQEGVKLVGKDRTDPPRSAQVESNVVIKVTRVKEEVITEDKPIEFVVEYRLDPTLELDERHVEQEGRNGIRKQQTHIVYENGEEVSRTIEKQWIDTPAVNRIVDYGTKIVVRELDTPEGTLAYWRKLRMWGTSYNASHGDKSPDDPAYGITRMGIRVTHGIVAIDPNVIPFFTRVYVPGYGVGLAADTGGGIKGMMIDLGFEETEDNDWSAHWTDVYILTPVPPADEIRFRMPDR